MSRGRYQVWSYTSTQRPHVTTPTNTARTTVGTWWCMSTTRGTMVSIGIACAHINSRVANTATLQADPLRSIPRFRVGSVEEGGGVECSGGPGGASGASSCSRTTDGGGKTSWLAPSNPGMAAARSSNTSVTMASSSSFVVLCMGSWLIGVLLLIIAATSSLLKSVTLPNASRPVLRVTSTRLRRRPSSASRAKRIRGTRARCRSGSPCRLLDRGSAGLRAFAAA